MNKKDVYTSGMQIIYHNNNLKAWMEQDRQPIGIHLHEDMEILYVLSGRMAIFKGDKNFVLHGEDFLLLNSFERHELYIEKGCHLLSFYFSTDLLKLAEFCDVDLVSPLQLLKKDAIQQMRTMLASLAKHASANHPPAEPPLVLSEILALLGMMQSICFDKGKNKEPRKMDAAAKTGKERLHEVLSHIHRHYEEDCSLHTLSERFYLSSGHLSRLFLQETGMHCHAYVRRIRLAHAAMLLSNTQLLITEIAFQSGYQNSNTFSAHFRACYGMSPMEYRKQPESRSIPFAADNQEDPNSGQSSNGQSPFLVSLLKHAVKQERLLPYHPDIREPAMADLDLRKPVTVLPRPYAHALVLNMGYASSYLYQRHYTQMLTMAKERIGFRYVFHHGIYDDAMHVVNKNAAEDIWYDFRLLDRMTDCILALGMLPYYEFSRTPPVYLDSPQHLFHNGYIQIPDDLTGWKKLLSHTLEHFAARYGASCVAKWRFALLPPMYLEWDIFSMEEYLDYYRTTFVTIRSMAPGAKIGAGTFDIGRFRFQMEKGKANHLLHFLSAVKNERLLPDFLTLQDFGTDYFGIEEPEIYTRFLKQEQGQGEALHPAEDPDQLLHNLRLVQSIQEQAGTVLPMELLYWNSTFWGQDLGNDTCFKAAYYAKSFRDTLGIVDALGYSAFYDETEDGLFEGGNGAVTIDGIPKAVEQTMELLSLLENQVIGTGDGWLVSASDDKKRITILLYNYGHYNRKLHLDYVLPKEEQLNIDRYYAFYDHGNRHFILNLRHLRQGCYTCKKTMISRNCGSSYDAWIRMGAPAQLSDHMRKFLIRHSDPDQVWEQIQISENEDYTVNQLVETHSVQLIALIYSETEP